MEGQLEIVKPFEGVRSEMEETSPCCGRVRNCVEMGEEERRTRMRVEETEEMPSPREYSHHPSLQGAFQSLAALTPIPMPRKKGRR